MLPKGGDLRRNYILGVLNGSIFQFGTAFLDPTTVMPVFIKRLTGSDFVVGLASAMRRAGWYLPQLPMAAILESRVFKLNIYIGANAVRMGLVWVFVPLLALFGVDHPSLVLAAFVVMFGISSLVGGIAGAPFIDIVGKTVAKRSRGTYYALRAFFGAGLSIAAGLGVRYILAEDGYDFPTSYVILFLLAAGFMTLGIIFFALVREPPGKPSATRRTFAGVIGEIPSILERDPNFRRLLLTQILAAGIGFSLPFYVVLARESFGTTESASGIFLMAQTLGATLSTLAWGRISAKHGNRLLVLLVAVAQAAIPIYALTLIFGFSEELIRGPDWVVTASFTPVFFLMGGAMSGAMIGFTSLLLNIAPEERRPTYVGISNTAMGCASLFPALGGILADMVALQGVFVVSALATCASVYTARRIREPD